MIVKIQLFETCLFSNSYLRIFILNNAILIMNYLLNYIMSIFLDDLYCSISIYHFYICFDIALITSTSIRMKCREIKVVEKRKISCVKILVSSKIYYWFYRLINEFTNISRMRCLDIRHVKKQQILCMKILVFLERYCWDYKSIHFENKSSEFEKHTKSNKSQRFSNSQHAF